MVPAKPRVLEPSAPRMQRYLPYIYQQVAARNLPTELVPADHRERPRPVRLFRPTGANELWQFIRPTAKQYGLVHRNRRWAQGCGGIHDRCSELS